MPKAPSGLLRAFRRPLAQARTSAPNESPSLASTTEHLLTAACCSCYIYFTRSDGYRRVSTIQYTRSCCMLRTMRTGGRLLDVGRFGPPWLPDMRVVSSRIAKTLPEPHAGQGTDYANTGIRTRTHHGWDIVQAITSRLSIFRCFASLFAV